MTTTSMTTPWHQQPWIRFTDCDRSVCIAVSSVFLRSNPNLLFYNMFNPAYAEPNHEDYVLSTGKTVKVYPLDLDALLLNVILKGLLWQCNKEVMTRTEAERIYKDLIQPHPQRSINYYSWMSILEYYGFILPEGAQQQLNYIPPTPPQQLYAQFASRLIADVLTQHPKWSSFIAGLLPDTIIFQFAAYVGKDKANYRYVHCIYLQDDKRLVTATYLARAIPENDDAQFSSILKKTFIQHIPALQNCNIHLEWNPKSRVVKYWPLTHNLMMYTPGDNASTLNNEPELENVELPNGYKIINLKLSWSK